MITINLCPLLIAVSYTHSCLSDLLKQYDTRFVNIENYADYVYPRCCSCYFACDQLILPHDTGAWGLAPSHKGVSCKATHWLSRDRLWHEVSFTMRSKVLRPTILALPATRLIEVRDRLRGRGSLLE